MQAQEATAEQGGSCITLCRKATKVSQKQIKEDVSKHQRRACSTALESFRGSNPERVTGKSPFCFLLCLGKTGFATAGIRSSAKERGKCPAAGQAGCEDAAPGVGVAEGQPGHSFSLQSPLPQLLKRLVFQAVVIIPAWVCAGRRLSLEKKCGLTN